MKSGKALPVRMCSHHELMPTRFDQPRPEPCEVRYFCECGQNWGCPVCHWGSGCYPCACQREALKVRNV